MFERLQNKKVYLAPYNDLSLLIFSQLITNGVPIVSFIDTFKKGENIISPQEIKEYDYVIVSSSEFWFDICKNFDYSKILLSHTNQAPLVEYELYISSFDKKHYDILFLAYNRSQVIDASLVIRELVKKGFTGAIVDTNGIDRENMQKGLKENTDIPIVAKDSIKFLTFKSLVCLIDWADRHLIRYCQHNHIKTIGLIDGIEDFEDADYNWDRKAYQTVEYVLVAGRHDLTFFENKLNKCSIVGLPKMYHLWNKKVIFPEEILIIINVNFTYGTFENIRDIWVSEVVNACKFLNLKYVISQHHADKGNLQKYNTSSDDIYSLIEQGTLIISRFSTIISESLALGKPVVYHNPHQEKVTLYKNPIGAYSISNDLPSLVSMIQYELSNLSNIKERATQFLDLHFNILEKKEPALLSAEKIIQITESSHI